MVTCPYCGTQSPDTYPKCPNCGAQFVPQQTYQQPQPMQQPMGGYVPPAYQQEPVTSVGAWFGWSLLIGLLPLIGAIIMLCAVKDPSAKNYAKLIVILQGIIIAVYILLIVFVSVVSSNLYY